MSQERLLQRFLEYVRIDTTAVEGAACYPSSTGQLELGKLLVGQLREIGLDDAAQDEHGIVMATLPSSVDEDLPVIAFNSHFDTSPETTGAGVKPQVIRNYPGGDITLPADPRRIIQVDENPELDTLVGKTLITTDGTTLLGGDDKAGIAVIIEAMQRLIEQPDAAHGPIRVLFTCDEEIGHGVDQVDLENLAAVAGYTLDGPAAGDIDIETFSADLATITITGVNIHPSIAKDRMVNAMRAAGLFLAHLPERGISPETTSGRQGFLHPYKIEGGVAQVTIQILLRDFETAGLAVLAEHLHTAAAQTMTDWPGARVAVAIKTQYRNMAEGLDKEPRAVEYAEHAFRALGIEARKTIIRGGTDGSQLTEKGLPTPNLSTGQHNPHSPLEWACLEEMEQAVEVVVALAKQWAERR